MKETFESPSEPVQDVLNNIPGGLLRWGTTLLGLIVLLMLLVSYFVQYPDVVYSEVRLTSVQSTVYVSARSASSVEQVFIDHNQWVDSGAVLAIVRNSARSTDVFNLERVLKKQVALDALSNDTLWLDAQTWELGDLQEVFDRFREAGRQYRLFSDNQFYQNKKELLSKQVEVTQAQLKNMRRQQEWLRLQVNNATLQFHRDSSLFQKGLLAQEEFERKQQDFWESEQSFAALEAEIRSVESTMIQTKTDYLEVSETALSTESARTMSFKSALSNVLVELEQWKQRYVLLSPCSGRVHFMNASYLHRQTQVGDVLFTITPDETSEPIAEAFVEPIGKGKVHSGQLVHIRLHNYPDTEYGYLYGTVESISEVPMPDGKYVARIVFNKGLKTSYHIELPQLGTMTGVAEIITQNYRLIERLMLPIRKLASDRFVTNGE